MVLIRGKTRYRKQTKFAWKRLEMTPLKHLPKAATNQNRECSDIRNNGHDSQKVSRIRHWTLSPSKGNGFGTIYCLLENFVFHVPGPFLADYRKNEYYREVGASLGRFVWQWAIREVKRR
uniref:Uncharacterized protein n=1 Tax=Steinernema glaseri TaxID=37863 RepID=A0A1I7ZS04_9BILA